MNGRRLNLNPRMMPYRRTIDLAGPYVKTELYWKEHNELKAELEKRGKVVGDPKYFIVKKCKQLICMNTLGNLPACGRDFFKGCLTPEGEAELELRLFLKNHPGSVPKEYMPC